MNRLRPDRVVGCLAVAFVAALPALVAQQKPAAPAWTGTFDVRPASLGTAGQNPYFILQPGYQLTLEGQEDGTMVRLVVTMLDETKIVGGIETRVVEERETHGGALAEVSRNYFAVDKETGTLYYFGEDVDTYKNGKVVNHEGAWHHGTGGARFGMMLPGLPAPGMRYYQEQAPGVAMDRAEVVSVSETITVPAGTFTRCLKTEETTPLEPGTREYKVYAPGVGLVKDGTLELVSWKKK